MKIRALSANLVFLILASFVSVSAYAQSGPSALNLSGGLFLSNGQPVLQNHVNFKVEILDKAATCVLYRELHLGEDLSNTKGGFSLLVGQGTSIQNLIDSGATVLSSKIFENTGSPQSFSGCGGVTLTSGDERMIRIYYDLGAGYVAMSPDVPVVSSAYAMVADSLQGKHAADFLQVNGTASGSFNQPNADYAFSLTNWPRLKALLDGTSTQYMTQAPSAAVDFNGQRLTNLASPGTTSDAATKGYADTSIGGKNIDLTGVGLSVGDGKALVWDATLDKWVTGNPIATDSTKLALAGGTMSGAISMGGYDLYAVGNLTMSPLKAFTLGTYTDADEATLVAGLLPANKGASWYNSTGNVYKIWNGTAAVPQAYLDSVTGKIAAGWLPNTSVVAGTYGTSASKVPTFTVGSDGRLTAAGEITISGVAPGGSAGGDLTGTYPNPTITTNAVTNTKVNDGAISTGKLSSTSAASGGRVLLTDIVDPNQIVYFECNVGEVMKWTATGWACATVASLAPVTSVAGKTGVVTLNSGDISGLGTAALVDYGTAASELVQLNASAQLPAVDGSLLTGVNAVKLQSYAVSATAPTANQVLKWNGSLSVWEPQADSSGSGDFKADGSVAMTGALLGLSGTQTAPGYSFNGDTNTGMFRGGADSVSLTAGGARQLTIQPSGLTIWNDISAQDGDGLTWGASQLQGIYGDGGASGSVSLWSNNLDRLHVSINGNVGIGTTNPQSILDVYATGTGASALIIPRDTTAGQPSAPVNGMMRYNTSTSKFEFYQNAAWVNYGTGSGSVSFPLAAPNGSASAPSYNFASSTGTGMYSTGANSLAFATSGTSAMTINNVGYVGIGTTSPTYPLDLRGAGAKSQLHLANNGSDAGGYVMSLADNEALLAAGASYNGTSWVSKTSSGSGILEISGGALTFFSNTVTSGSTYAVNSVLKVQANGNLAVGDTLNYNPNFTISLSPNSPRQIGLERTTVGLTAGQNLTVSAGSAYPGDSNLVGGDLILTAGTATGNGSSNVYLKAANGGSSGSSDRVPTTKMSVLGSGKVGIGTTNPLAILDLYATGTGSSALIVPRDTTSGRPAVASSVNGMMRYNTDLSAFEFFQNGAWSTFATGASAGDFKADGTIPMTGAFRATNGTVGAPSISFTSDTNTGLYRSNADELTIATNGADRLTVGNGYTDSANDLQFPDNIGVNWGGDTWITANTSGTRYMTLATNLTERIRIQHNGLVGIGTSSPKAIFDVYATGTGASALIVPRDTTANQPSAPVNGMMRYNTNTNRFEFYQDAAWVNYGTGSGSASFPLAAPNGTVSAPSYNFSSSVGTGMYSAASNSLSLATHGTSAVTIDSGGNVGIGISAPDHKLDIRGNEDDLIRMQNTNASGYSDLVAYDNSGTAKTEYGFANSSAGQSHLAGRAYIWAATGTDFAIANDSAALMTIKTSSGNVGVGTTTPMAALDIVATGTGSSALIVPRDTTAGRPALVSSVNGMMRYNTDLSAFEFFQNGVWATYNTGSAGAVSFPLLASPATSTAAAPSYSFTGNSNTGFYSPAANQVALSTYGTARLTVDASGNIGIGTTSPGVALEVAGTITNNGNAFVGNGNAQFIELTTNGALASHIAMKNGATNVIYLPTGSSSGAGNVGIGTTSPLGILDLAATGTGSSVLVVPRDTTAGRPAVASSVNGMMRYNTNLAAFEFFQNGVWATYNTGSAGALSFPLLASPATSTAAAPSYSFTGNANTGFYSPAVNQVALSTYGTARMTVDASGNVGIGTSTPTAKLSIAGGNLVLNNNGSAADNILIGDPPALGYPGIWFGPAAASPTYTNYSFLSDGTGGNLFNSAAGQVTRFRINNTAVMTVGGSGINIGGPDTGLPADAPAYPFQVQAGTGSFVVNSAGNVGIGIAPASTLQVAGAITNVVSTFNTVFTCGTSAIDFSASNFVRLSPSNTIATGACGVPLTNLVAGGSYTMVVTGNAATNAVTYGFTGYTFKYLPTNGATTASKDTIYTFLYDGATVYVTWSGGY